MIEFVHPLALLLLLAVPVLVWWWLRGRPPGIRYSETESLAALPKGRGPQARRVGALLRSLCLLCLILALAGPRWPDLHTRINTQGIAIQMVVDISGSMAEKDFDWQGTPISRLDAVKKTFELFVTGGEDPDGQPVEGRPADLIGMIAFATWPDTVCPLTLSHATLLHLLAKLEPRTVPTEARTNIGDAIAWGLHRLEGAQTTRKIMILLSDGEHNVPPPALKPRQAAQLAANQRIPIYTIDAAGDTVVEEGVTDANASRTAAEIRESAAQALQAVARISGGRYFQARDTGSLLAACREIDRMERTDIQSFFYQRYYEGYPWAGLASFLCLVLATILDMTVWRRIP
jgi:Ca-activated chloride channel family protein